MSDYDQEPAPEPHEEEAEAKTAEEETQAAIKDIAQAIHRGLNPKAPDNADVSPYMEFASMYYYATNPPPEPAPAEEAAPEAQAA